MKILPASILAAFTLAGEGGGHGHREEVDPWYPSAAGHDRIEARIEALMRVSDAGKVEEVVIVPGAYESQFGEAATTALMQWEFAPGKRPWHCYLHVLDFRPSDYKPRGHVIR